VEQAAMRLVQLIRDGRRQVAIVDEPRLRLIRQCASIHELASRTISEGTALTQLAESLAGSELLDYDAIYSGNSDWKLLCPIDHPVDPARLLVSGTGLTHLGSARNRQAMHGPAEVETDSMKMFRWGVEGGKPAAGQVGVAPEWFYKGNGLILRGPGDDLQSPPYALDGGEEGEIAGVYLIDAKGQPHRVGLAIGNEFSDHVFEKKNYLNLAGSKLRQCSIGPELVIDPVFSSVAGNVHIERAGTTVWSKSICTGEAEMSHSLANIEHHHFKFESHRRPGDLHVHYFGACALSFGDGFQLRDGDTMVVSFESFGRPIRNRLRIIAEDVKPITVPSL
jgi:hypothetical protein